MTHLMQVISINFAITLLKAIWVSPLVSSDSSGGGKLHSFCYIITDTHMGEISRFR